MFLRLLNLCFFGALALLAATGCAPSGSSALDEQKEPHFIAGKSRENALDYKGAIEAFERALEVNPRSASAHFELGLLYEKTEMDYAAAIYHFEKFLKLRPHDEYAEMVKPRILACKQELAKSVSLAPVTQTMQRDLERLAAENRDLKQQLEAWQAARSNQVAAVASVALQNSAAPNRASPVAMTPRPATPAPAASTRTHVVQPGESPYTIARKYNVKLDALMAANPRLDPRKLKVGQTLNIPAAN